MYGNATEGMKKSGQVRCKNKHIDEKVLYKAFVGSFDVLVENKDEFIKKWKAENEDEFKRYKAWEFIKIIKSRKINEFNIDLYFRMIEKMTIFKGKIIVGMLDGTEVECAIE